jgi:hypothetical protein
MPKLKLFLTLRGFARAEFDDLYGSKCSIQESSLADQHAIWLGVHEPSPQYQEKKSSRMHLNQEQAAQLLPLIERFVKTGGLWPKGKKRKNP